MKVHYNNEDNILMIELNNKKIDDAYEEENMIVHVSENKEPVLLEILDASAFLKKIASELPKVVKESILSSSLSVAHKLK